MIGKQLYITYDNTRQHIHPVRNSEETVFIKKPARDTGLWTSTFREETLNSGWVEWCRGENFGDPYNKNWFLLTPRDDVRLYTINGISDLLDLLRSYPWMPESMKSYGFEYFMGIDFERMALDYDGIWLTEKGNSETHFSYPHDLNAWDCESVLWFKWCFTSVERIETPQPVVAGVA